MAKFDRISTETWKIELPSDWIEPKPDAEEDHYFESADGTKGAYISSWCFRNDARLAAEILESFREVEVSSLHEIKGRSWKALDEWSSKKGNVSTLGGDYLDEANNYRIVYQLIARLPWVVRANFHDYDCRDYKKSKRFFRPIIKSLHIHA